MNNGDVVVVYQEDTDDQGNQVWNEWFTGTYLTTENVGNGPELRIRDDRSGQHIHIKEYADDIKVIVDG